MAILTHAIGATPSDINSIDFATTRLSRLLSRLQQTVLHADPERERRLRTSEFERARVESNLEYARNSLTKLEQDALAIKAPGRRMEVQTDLNQKREMLELILDRLQDLKHMAIEDDEASSDDEDILGEIIPTPSESLPSISQEDTSMVEEEDPEADLPATDSQLATQAQPESTPQPERAPEPTPTEAPSQTLTTKTSQTLRPRNRAAPTQNIDTASTSARPSALSPPPPPRRQPAAPQTSTATAEAILDNQRAEQDVLSESILKMASALKASSQKFSTKLEEDNEVLSRAGDRMNKTERGMEAARGRMGTLKKMTEGKGWWGRIMLYAWVYGMMVVLVLLVFVVPKLRL